MHSTDSQQCLSLELLSTTCIFHTLEIYTLQAFTLLKYYLHLPVKENQIFLVKSCEENKMNVGDDLVVSPDDSYFLDKKLILYWRMVGVVQVYQLYRYQCCATN